jgi:6-phosphogluconolactonase
MASLTVAADEQDLARQAAGRITGLIAEAIAARGNAVVSLTGGSTPRRLYSLLADRSQPWRDRVDWSRVHLFWGDERHVPPDHAESNFGMAEQALVGRVAVPAAQVHRMRGELADAADAARQYEHELATGFQAAGRADQTFDVMLLGLGEDAHIASIFPGSELLQRAATSGGRSSGPSDAAGPRVSAVWAGHLSAWRITLTPAAILDSRAIVMLVGGGTKADAVHAALEAPLDITRWPAQLLREADERVEWIIDRAAASRLPQR